MATHLRLVASDRELQRLIEKGLEVLQRLNPEAFAGYAGEITFGLGEMIQDEWVRVPASSELRKVAERTADQLFRVGEPLRSAQGPLDLDDDEE